MANKPTFAYAKLNARVQPLDRGERYEDPLIEVLEKDNWAAVTGGGTSQEQTGEIDYCGIDLDLHDIEKAVPLICKVLTECGAPKGSQFEYQLDGKDHKVPFGNLEGIAVYLNGTDLPDSTYENYDSNDVYNEINKLLWKKGAIQGNWRGPTELALYLYGNSAAEMKSLIAEYTASHPLCQKCRVVEIA